MPRGALFLLLGTQLLAGCQSWRASSLGPQALLEEERPGMIRVTLDDGRVATLSDPRMVADTIVGTGDTQRAAAGEVRTLEVRRTSIPRTVALMVAHVTAVVTVVAFIIEIQPHYRGF